MANKRIFGRASQNRIQAAKYILGEAILFFAIILFQTSVLSVWKPFGVVPDIAYGALILIAYFCGKETGAVTGIAVGFAVEALGSVGISLLPVLYLFAGYVCGFFTRAILPRRFTAFLAVLSAAIPARSVITLIYTCLHYEQIHLPRILLDILLPEAMTTAVLTCLLYFPIKLLANWMGK